MELIMIRHGKAEERGSRSDDDGRELTPEGRKKVSEMALGLKQLVAKRKKLYIWSSPLLRAWQTAEIVAEVLRVKYVEAHESLCDGNLESLAAKLELAADADAVIVVGHEPILSEWCEKICGVALPFKKGAVAGIKIDTWVPPAGVLSWFAQPKALSGLKR